MTRYAVPRAAAALAVLLSFAAPVGSQVILDEVAGVPGLEAGDRIDAWRRTADSASVESGPLSGPFDLLVVLDEQMPRGPVEVRRGETWIRLPRAGATLRAADRAEGGATSPAHRAWAGYRTALGQARADDLEAAVATLASAAATPGLEPLPEVLLHAERAGRLNALRRPAEALAAAEAAVEALARAGADLPVLAARIGSDRGLFHLLLGQHEEAELRLTAVARTLAVYAPGSREEGRAWGRAGIAALHRGDYAAAEERFERAVECFHESDEQLGRDLNSLAILAKQRGDLARAEALYLRALSLQSDGAARAGVEGNLANVYLQRGELERARELLGELVRYYRTERPEAAFARANVLTNLAEAERQAGDLAAAETHVRAALAINEVRIPQSAATANALNALGRILRLRERSSEARAAHRRALAVAEAVSPAGPLTAESHAELGAVDLAAGDLDAAESRYRRAVDLQRGLAAGTIYEARWLHALARIEELRGRHEAALSGYREALTVLDGLRGRLGGAAEAGAGFTSLHQELYWRPLDRLAASGRTREAFDLSERYRAQAFLAMLATRDLDLSADLPPELDRERRRQAVLYDTTLERLLRAGAEERETLRGELDRVRLRQQEVEDRIGTLTPRLARLRNPVPVTAASAAAQLPPDTLLLSFVTGPERTWLFVLGADGSEPFAAEIPAGADELARRVRAYRELVARPSARSLTLRTTGAELTATLLDPVADRLRSARRLVVLPDGPLHLLPWSALPDPAGDPAGDELPLIAGRPISVAASATVLGELRSREAAAPRELVAFGAPDAVGAGPAPSAAPPILRAGREPSGLPGSRLEVQALGELFGEGADLYVGDRVTEERLVDAGARARRLHLACHAVVDPALPLESGLVLTAPENDGGGNGFFQAWEIYQRLRLDADLVTLSACETALGRTLAGEGVLGLTRAFHYAGARTVISSLWKVSDEAAARLMRSFYRHLLEGAGKAEALRRAQLEMIGGDGSEARWAHPFYWAAFQLHGAWE